MGYKEKQAGRGREPGEVVGDEWMCSTGAEMDKSEQDGRMEGDEPRIACFPRYK